MALGCGGEENTVLQFPCMLSWGTCVSKYLYTDTSIHTYILEVAHNGETVTGGECRPQLTDRTAATTTLRFCTGSKLLQKFLSDYGSAPFPVTSGALHTLYEGQNMENSEERAGRSMQTKGLNAKCFVRRRKPP